MILRGDRVEINKVIEKLQKETRIRLVYCKVAPADTFLYIRVLRQGEEGNGKSATDP
jgi:hypothetical protein